MADSKRIQRLNKSIDMLQARYGSRVVQPARNMSRQEVPPHVPTGFTQLDAITGCGGIPLNAITRISGATTSGKLTLAYKVLANAQRARRMQRVALLDLTCAANPDSLAQCGVDLDYLLFIRTPSPLQATDLIFDLARSDLRLLVIDSLPDLLRDVTIARRFDAALPRLQAMLGSLPCAVLFIDEPRPPWLRWLPVSSSAIAHCAALHIDLKREQWLEQNYELVGYRVQAQVIKTRWARSGQTAPIEIFLDQL